MYPLPWSLLSLLTNSLTNYCLIEEEWNTEGHPVSITLGLCLGWKGQYICCVIRGRKGGEGRGEEGGEGGEG